MEEWEEEGELDRNILRIRLNPPEERKSCLQVDASSTLPASVSAGKSFASTICYTRKEEVKKRNKEK